MKCKLPGILMAMLVVLGAAVPVFGHHAFGVVYDGSKCMDLKGTLTSVQWENPHAYIDVDVKEADGKVVTWHLEMVTPNALKRTGTTRQDFEANFGKTINVRACPARLGNTETRRSGSAGYLALSDGLIRLTGQQQNGPKHF